MDMRQMDLGIGKHGYVHTLTNGRSKFKRMADDLGDLIETVADRTHVLNVLRGLNEKFAPLGRLLRRGRSFPSFVEVCDDLLEELHLGGYPAPASALLTGTSQSSPRPPASPSNRSGYGGKGNWEGGNSSGSKSAKGDRSNRPTKGSGGS